MKAFSISLITLLVVTSTIILNCIQIGRICDSLLQLAENLPDAPDDGGEAMALYDYFIKKEGYLELSVNHEEIDTIENLIWEIKTKSEPSDYAFAVRMFKLKTAELKKSEGISLGRIL